MKETVKSVLQQCIVGAFMGMLVAIPSSGEAMPPQFGERVNKTPTQPDVSQPGRSNSADCFNTQVVDGNLLLPKNTLYGIRQNSQEDGTPASLFYQLVIPYFANFTNLPSSIQLSFNLDMYGKPVGVSLGHGCGDSGFDSHVPAQPIEF